MKHETPKHTRGPQGFTSSIYQCLRSTLVTVHDPTNLVEHPLGVGEEPLVPREVPLAIRVLDVQPDDVVREVSLLETGVDGQDVLGKRRRAGRQEEGMQRGARGLERGGGVRERERERQRGREAERQRER